MNIECFPKDIQKLFESFLSSDELTYYSNKWFNFRRSEACHIAAKNGWIDLLEFFYIRDYGTNMYIEYGHIEVLK